jgi:hypothetical protein
MGRAFRAGPARMGLYSAVLGQKSKPVGRHGPTRLIGRAQIGRAQTGSGWAGPCRPFEHLYVGELLLPDGHAPAGPVPVLRANRVGREALRQARGRGVHHRPVQHGRPERRQRRPLRRSEST